MRRTTTSERGFVLVTVAVSILVIVAMLGLAIDLGRAFITKNEAQAYTDAAALAAASELNGTAAGITAATNAVAGNANRWNMATRTFTGVVTEFSTDRTNWSDAATASSKARYVRVTAATNSVAIYFMTALGVGQTLNVAARSTAGIELPGTYAQGLFPFAPIAHNQTPPDFGYSRGDELTLLWPASIGSNGPVKMNNLCGSDQNQAALDAVKSGTTSERGYIQETSASAIGAAIEDDHMDYVVTLGLPVFRSSGVKNTDIKQSLAARVAQDSLPQTAQYATYLANHDSGPRRRLVVVPIIGDALNAVVVGFATVFLPPSQPNNPNDSKCAMYIGPASDALGASGATGSNIVRILE
jgi:Flp pilus assembly protein TadG